MARTRQETSLEEVINLFKGTPVWVGPVAATVVFVSLKYLAPLLIPAAQPGTFDPGILLKPLFGVFAWALAGAVLFAWGLAEVWKLTNRGLFTSQSSIETIRKLSWREFERLVCEAYRRQGYAATLVGDDGTQGGDGGVDIELTRQGERVLVQCKQWRTFQVGVTAVRELMGVVAAEGATKGILVTSGGFTHAALRFAKASPRLQLVAGPELNRLIRVARSGSMPQPAEPEAPTAEESVESPRCPACGIPMVQRTAAKGPHAGTQFWGCSRFPVCREIRTIQVTR